MSAPSHPSASSHVILRKVRRFVARGRRAARLAAAATLLACFFVEATHGAPARADDKPLLSNDDGFTRESLTEFDAPEPAPFALAPAASVDEMASEGHARRMAARRRHRLHRQQASQNTPQVVVAKPAKRRNPAESFVYWWNGWVIRTFHTKAGTVLLASVGAKA